MRTTLQSNTIVYNKNVIIIAVVAFFGAFISCLVENDSYRSRYQRSSNFSYRLDVVVVQYSILIVFILNCRLEMPSVKSNHMVSVIYISISLNVVKQAYM